MNTDKEKQYSHIDQAFADFILRLAGRTEDTITEQAVLELSSAVSGGASCIEVSDELKTHLLENCAGAVGEYQKKGLSLPLILDGNYLYFQKLLKYEVQLAELFLNIAAREVPALPEEANADKLFSSLEEKASTEEKRAAIRTFIRKIVWDGENAHLYLFHNEGDCDFPAPPDKNKEKTFNTDKRSCRNLENSGKPLGEDSE